MVKRALCAALGLVGACLPAVAQQASSPEWPVGAFDPDFALNVYQPRISGPGDSFLLFHRGPVSSWSDGGWLANASGLNQITFASLDFLPAAFLTPEALSGPRTTGARNSRTQNSGTDGKDFSNEMLSSSPVYYGGEVGFVYGQWSGKGGGNMWETYVTGTVGNDKFQINAGAAFDEWSGTGRSVRFRSFAAPR